MSIMQSAPGPETVIDGKRYLYFGGTSYLGLAAHPEVIEAGCAALRQFGLHTATTRARFGTSPPVLEVERRAAEFFATEDAFYFTSGYCANHILMAALAPDADAVLVDEAAHYSVVEAARLAEARTSPFRPRDADDLARLVRGHRRVLVMADAVGPSTGVLAPVADYLRALTNCERATLMLDDAHGFGVLGPAGRGLLDELDLWPQANHGASGPGVSFCVGGTLSKALGGFGAYAAGSRTLCDLLINRCSGFIYATALPPAVLGAMDAALDLVVFRGEVLSGIDRLVAAGGLKGFDRD